jgi:hypothetical protein
VDWSTAHHAPKRQEPPTLQLIRTLWVVTRPPNRSITAGIYENPCGHELRVYYGQDENNVVSTSLSRASDEPLEHEASEIRAVLESKGWTATT